MEIRAGILLAATLGLMGAIFHISASTSFVCPEESGQFPDPVNCRKYYLCWGSNATDQMCPQNMLFDVNQAICLLKDEVNCASRQNPDDGVFNCTSNYGLYPDDQNPNAYYYCTGGEPAHMYCPCGTVFDADQNAQCVPQP